jgi:hypothetical protein
MEGKICEMTKGCKWICRQGNGRGILGYERGLEVELQPWK